MVQGLVGMNQLAGLNFSWQMVPDSNGNQSTIYNNTGGSYLLDYAVQYPQQQIDGPDTGSTVSLSGGGTATWSSFDDNYVALFACTDFDTAEDYFEDYFFFLPNPKTNYSSIPVTLGSGTWSWQGYSVKPDNVTTNYDTDWGGAGAWQEPTWSQQIPDSTLPQWSGGLVQDTVKNGPTPQC